MDVNESLGARILIGGYYGFGNTGDEAILYGILRDLRSYLPSASFVVVSGIPSQTRQTHGVESILWTNINALNEAARQSDLVILGGGGLFHDYWPANRKDLLTSDHSGLSYYAGVPLLASLLRKPSMIYGVGVGPLSTLEGRYLTRLPFRLANTATVRDIESLRLLEEMGVLDDGLKETVSVTADPAFSMPFPAEERIGHLLASHGIKASEQFLVVCPRYWDIEVDFQYWVSELSHALDLYLDRTSLPILFLPFQRQSGFLYEDDWSVCVQILDAMQNSERCVLLDYPLDASLALGVIKQSQGVLAMRLHASLFGINAKVPVVSLGYDPKVINLMNRFGLVDYCLLPHEWRSSKILECLTSAAEQGLMPSADILSEARSLARSNALLASQLIGSEAIVNSFELDILRELTLQKITALDVIDDRPSTDPVEIDQKSVSWANIHPQIESIINEQGNTIRLLNELMDVQKAEQALELSRIQEETELKYEVLRRESLAATEQLKNEMELRQDHLKAELEHLRSAHEVSKQENENLRAEINLIRRDSAVSEGVRHELSSIHGSRYWRYLGYYWAARNGMRRWGGAIFRRLKGQLRKARARVNNNRFHKEAASRTADWKSTVADAFSTVSIPGSSTFDLIVLPIIDWDFRYQRPQQLASQFADQGHRVFYLRTTFHQEKSVDISEKRNQVFEVGLTGDPGCTIYKDTLTRTALEVLEHDLAELRVNARINEAVLLVQLPFWTPLAEKLRKRFGWKIVYDCLDDHRGFETNHEDMLESEDHLLETCDLAIATSKELYRKCSTRAKKTILLPNAADNRFFTLMDLVSSRPVDFPDGPAPVIGYIGAISTWFDFDLLRDAVHTHPDWNFVFVGSTWDSDRHQDLKEQANVYLLGEKPNHEVPAYLAHMDVCLIPFKINQLTISTNPVKVYEYLAAGKPVVSVALPDLKDFQPWVKFANTPEDFTQAIKESLESQTVDLVSSRRDFIRDHTWEARYLSLSEELKASFGSVSVIMPTKDNLPLTKKCIESLWRTTTHPNFELIVVDNASSDGTQDYLSELAANDSRLRVIPNADNRGFAAAINQGLETSIGDFVVLLNNDVELTPGWLAKMLERLERDSSIGLIGPVSNSVGNEAKVDVDYVEMVDMEPFAEEFTAKYIGELAPISMLAFYCVVGRRKVFKEVGLLDERFGIGMFEDDDYAIRVRLAGYRIVCARDVYVHHHGRAAFKQLGTWRYREVFEANKTLFEEKWGIAWEHPTYGDLDQAMELSKVLQRIIDAHQDTAGVVILPPTEQLSENERYNLEILVREFSERGYLSFIWNGTNGTQRISELGRNLYLSSTAPEVFDVIQSPYLIHEGNDRSFGYKLRAPEILHEDQLTKPEIPNAQTR